MKNNKFDFVRTSYKHPQLSMNAAPHMKEEIVFDLKKAGFNFEWIFYLRFCHKAIEDDYERDIQVLEDMQAKLLDLSGEMQVLLQKEVF